MSDVSGHSKIYVENVDVMKIAVVGEGGGDHFDFSNPQSRFNNTYQTLNQSIHSSYLRKSRKKIPIESCLP